jgi:MFS family permease
MQSAPPLNAVTVILLASLYCAQGLPSGLLAHSLPTLMRHHGVGLEIIGLLKLLALPWVLKVLWAPWVDRLASPRLGHHRGWILPLQLSVVVVLGLIALLPPAAVFGQYLWLLLGLLLLVNLAAATQDIATDGLAVRLLPPKWRGLGNSLQVGGYKVGMLVSGSLLLIVIDLWGWHLSIGSIALLVALLLVPILLFPENKRIPFQPQVVEHQGGVGLIWRHYQGFVAQPGMGLWLAVLLTFKLGDALGSPMIKPMLVDQGWSTGAIGTLTLVSSLVGIGGALLGGLAYARLGAFRALMLFGLLQAVGIAAMALLVQVSAAPVWVYSIALFEQFADGMSTVALFAMMMNQCRAGHEGADFTVQASVQVVLGGVIGALSGIIAKQLGYTSLFGLAGLAGLGALVLVVCYFANNKKGATPGS